jgi:hypothetical protein
MLILQTVTEYPWYVHVYSVCSDQLWLVWCGVLSAHCKYQGYSTNIWWINMQKLHTHTAFKTNIYVYVKLLKKSFKTF